MTNIDFSVLVKALRDKRGLTQEQLAREIGVSFSTVNVWENGRRKPQPYLAKRLLEMADEAGLDPSEYVDTDGPPGSTRKAAERRRPR